MKALVAGLDDATFKKRGNCYAASEALYHILGGKAAGWKPMRVALTNRFNYRAETHWYLQHESGMILDPAVLQFDSPDWWDRPDYSKGVGCGFLTAQPSKRARDLILSLTWHTLTKRTQTQPPAGRPAAAGADEGGRRWMSRSSRPQSKPRTTNSRRSSTATSRPATTTACAR